MTQIELLQKKVLDVMTVDLITVNTNDTLHIVKSIFDDNEINHIPVVDDEDILMGIISRKDLLLLFDWGTKFGLKSSDLRNKHLMDSNTAEDLMTKQIVSVRPEDNLARCAEILMRNKFHALPVVVEGKIVGLITTFDMLVEAYWDIPLAL